MTPDQIYHRLCDEKILKARAGGGRSKKSDPLAIATDKDGCLLGKAEDGSVIKGKITGKSKARQLMEQAKKNGN